MKRTAITKRAAMLTAGLAVTVATVAGGTATAAASDRGESGVTSCYGGATSETFNMGTDESAHYFGPYYMGTACGDINLKLTKWGSARSLKTWICFSSSCDAGPTLKKSDVGEWQVLATDVIPGTKYKIKMDFGSHTFKGLLAD